MGWFNHQLEKKTSCPNKNHLSIFQPVSTPRSFPPFSHLSFPQPLAKARALQGLGRGGGFFERSVVEVDRTEVGHGVDGWLVGW